MLGEALSLAKIIGIILVFVSTLKISRMRNVSRQ